VLQNFNSDTIKKNENHSELSLETTKATHRNGSFVIYFIRDFSKKSFLMKPIFIVTFSWPFRHWLSTV